MFIIDYVGKHKHFMMLFGHFGGYFEKYYKFPDFEATSDKLVFSDLLKQKDLRI